MALNTKADGIHDGAGWVKNSSREVAMMSVNRKL